MKAILEFNLPEERSEFEDAVNGSEYHSVLIDFEEQLLKMIQNGETTTIHAVRDLLHEFMGGLKLYD